MISNISACYFGGHKETHYFLWDRDKSHADNNVENNINYKNVDDNIVLNTKENTNIGEARPPGVTF